MQPFAKYEGCGNDFILFDNRQGAFPYQPSLIRSLCHRQKGIGADGVLLLEYSPLSDARLRIFNANGTEVEMCGNGLRCFVKWLSTMGLNKSHFSIEVMGTLYEASIQNESVCIALYPPTQIQWNIALEINNRPFQFHHLNTGVPHTLAFIEDLEQFPLDQMALPIRHHSLWKDSGTNVSFVKIMGKQKLKIRTYERGVEAETLACGTGAVAAALAGASLYQLQSPISVIPPSSEELIVSFDFHEGNFNHVTLTGNARCTFKGEIDLLETFSL